MINIRLVQSGEKTNVWEGILPDEGLVRRMLPSSTLAPSQEQFEQGVPYGLPFASLVKPSEDLAENVEKYLHNAGIWTLDDLRTKGKAAVGAFQAAYGLELSRLIQIAETYKPVLAKAPKAKKKEIDNA
jgi:hypothetical protein